MGASALPRWSGRKTLVNSGRQDAGETGSSLSRRGVSPGTCPMPSIVPQWPSTRCVSKASRDGDVREHMANADMSASVQDISVSPPRSSAMLAKPLRTKPKRASAERCVRPFGATIDIATPRVSLSDRSRKKGIFA